MTRQKRSVQLTFEGFFIREPDGTLREATDKEIGHGLARAYRILFDAAARVRRRAHQSTEKNKAEP